MNKYEAWFAEHDLTKNYDTFAKSVNFKRIGCKEIIYYKPIINKNFLLIRNDNDKEFVEQFCLVNDDPNTTIPTLIYHPDVFKYGSGYFDWSSIGFNKIIDISDIKIIEFKTSEKYGIGVRLIDPSYIEVYDLEYNGEGYIYTYNLSLNSPEQLKYLLSTKQKITLDYIRKAIIIDNSNVEESLDIHQPYMIKVKDYTTEIVCRYNPSTDEYYIQRGDGEILQTYTSDRVIYKRLLKH